MSAINGNGHGSNHDWERFDTVNRTTKYKCKECDWVFYHHYPVIDNIFAAMEFEGVPEDCKVLGAN